jgi:hypothetical protein
MNTLPQPRKPLPVKAPEQAIHVENEPNQNAGGTVSAATSPIPAKLSAPPLNPSGTTTQPSYSPSYTDTTPGPSKRKEEEVPEPTAATSYPSPEIVTIE